MTIPQIPITRPELPPFEEYEALLREIWASRMLSNFGVFAQRLERLTTEYLGVPTRVVVSGDTGLVLTLAALGLPRRSRVVVPSFTFSSTVNAVIWNGLEPVLADIDPATFNVDPASVDEAIGRLEARAVIATHVFGNPADVDALVHTARRHGASIVFDAAHSYGAERDGQKVGTFGDAEVFSLSGTKLVTTAEGGLIASADADLLDRITYLRGYGFLGDYNTRYVGLNGKMSELHAALGTLTLARADAAISARHQIVDRYRVALEGTSVAFQRVRRSDRTTFKDFALRFESESARRRAESALETAGVQTKRYFLPAHQQDAYAELPSVGSAATDEVHSRLLCVPLYESIAADDIDRIAGVIRAATR